MTLLSACRVTLVSVEDVSNDVSNVRIKGHKERQAHGLCVRARCEVGPVDGHDYCEEHLEDHRRRTREAMARRRERWADAGQCTRCGGVRYRSSVHCRMCLIGLGRLNLDVSTDVSNKPKGHWEDRLEQSPDGVMRTRRRFVGQTKRGRRSIADMDGEDLRDASAELGLGVDGLKHFHSNEVKRLSKVARDEIEGQALSKLVRASRWIVEVIKRHGYEVPVVVSDDEE